MRELGILGTYNIRDLGGMTIGSGNSLKSKVLIRSGNLDKLPKASQLELVDYGIKTVIDVRDEWEVEHYPNPFNGSELVQYYNLPLIGDALSNDDVWKAKSKHHKDLADSYIKYLEGCKIQIGQIISTIANCEHGIIVHCHAGKDRTGIIVALILAVIGVSDDDIAVDYALSRQNIERLVQEWREYTIKNGRDLAKLERDSDSKPETMFKMLDYIREQYELVEAYLIDCGVSKTDLEQLRYKLIQPSDNG